MYLGTLATLDTDLADTDARLWQATRDYISQAAYYLGVMEGSGVDPVMWGNLKAQAKQIETSLPVWRQKYKALLAVKGQVDQAEWDRTASVLRTQGEDLINAVDDLNSALYWRKTLSTILGNTAATLGILTKVVAIEIPTIALKTVTTAAVATTQAAGSVLTAAGQAVGSTAAGIIDPIKGTLWMVLGLAAAGTVAYFYLMSPKRRAKA